MKTSNRTLKLTGLALMALMAVALAAVSLLLSPAAPAYADSPTPTPKAPGAAAETRLAMAYKYQQMRLRWQADRLTIADDQAELTQTMIENQKANGKDTAALEAALSTFKTQVAAARAAYETAAGILSAHAGFDNSGKVTDLTLARQTVKDANRALQDTNLALRQAELNLRIAVRAWRQANLTP